jgi:UDP-N-acetylglucosamine 4,6-dehydratase
LKTKASTPNFTRYSQRDNRCNRTGTPPTVYLLCQTYPETMIDGKTVLITGGGSVGKFLTRRFLSEGADTVRVLDNDEPRLARLKKEIDDERCRYLAGDVRDKDRLKRAVKNVDLVVHTAAMKHVDICEYNPFESVKTNVVGLQNLIDASIESSVERFVFTSSDKAVNPANTMGTTKLLGEKLVTAANKHKGRQNLLFTSVRFGNVIGSSGSVVPVFRRQIREGGPVTLTDSRMTRFFLTYEGLGELIEDAARNTRGGEVFVRKMEAVRIEDLAEAMIEKVAPEYGHDPGNIEVETTGRRLGETFHEEIITERESHRTVESDNLYAVLPESGPNGYLDHDGLNGFGPAEEITRSSDEAEKLRKKDITRLLDLGMQE